MDKKQMTLGEMIGWLDDNDVSYEIDDAGELTVKDDLLGDFRDWFGTCKYTGLPDELVRIDGDLWLRQASIVSLGGLTSVGGNLDLEETSITSLGDLTSVEGFLDLEGTPITSLGNLTSVGGDLDLCGTPITSLGDLTSVEGFLDLEGTPITSLGNLTSIGRFLDLEGTPITSLDNLTFVGGRLTLSGTSVTSLDDLPQVERDLSLDQSQLQLLTREALQKVKGKIQYRDQATKEWITPSPDELETIVAENERRERLNNTRGNQVDWDLYDR